MTSAGRRRLAAITALTLAACQGRRPAPAPPTARGPATVSAAALAGLVSATAPSVCAPAAEIASPVPAPLSRADAMVALRTTADEATGDRSGAVAVHHFGLAAFLRAASAEGEAQERRALAAPLAGSPGDTVDDLLARLGALAGAEERRALATAARPALATLAAAARSTELVRRAAAQAAAGRNARGLVALLAPAWGDDVGARAQTVLFRTAALYLGALADLATAAGLSPRDAGAADLPRLLAAARPDPRVDAALAEVARGAGVGDLEDLRLSDAAAVAAAGPRLCGRSTAPREAPPAAGDPEAHAPNTGVAPGPGAPQPPAPPGADLAGRGLATCGRHVAALAVASLAADPVFLREQGLPASPALVTARVLATLLVARRDAAMVLAAVEADARSDDALTLLSRDLSDALGLEVDAGFAALLAAHVGPFWCTASRLEAELAAPAIVMSLIDAGGARWWHSEPASTLLRELASSPYLRAPTAGPGAVAGWVGGKPLADIIARDLLEAVLEKTP